MRILFYLSCLGLAAAAITFDGSKKKPFRSSSTKTLEAELRIRGGGGPIDPDLAAKLLTGAYLVQGTHLVLAPKPAMEAYGMKDPSELSQICAASLGSYST